MKAITPYLARDQPGRAHHDAGGDAILEVAVRHAPRPVRIGWMVNYELPKTEAADPY